MDVQLLMADLTGGGVRDITGYVTKIEFDTQLKGEAGRLSVSCIARYVDVYEGLAVKLFVKGRGMFAGRIFRYSKSDKDIMSFTAYDCIRYLQYRDSLNFKDKTSAAIFIQICNMFKIPIGRVDEGYYEQDLYSFVNESYYDMISHSSEVSSLIEGRHYIIRDNMGKLEYFNILNSAVSHSFNEGEIISYSFESGIDKDTYNIAKIAAYEKIVHEKLTEDDNSENPENPDIEDNPDDDDYDDFEDVEPVEPEKPEKPVIEEILTSVVVPLGNTIDIATDKWGPLQYYEIVNLTKKQLAEYGNSILREKRRPVRAFAFTALGVPGLKAGDRVGFNLPSLRNKGIALDGTAIVNSCSHSISGNLHTVDVRVVFI